MKKRLGIRKKIKEIISSFNFQQPGFLFIATEKVIVAKNFFLTKEKIKRAKYYAIIGAYKKHGVKIMRKIPLFISFATTRGVNREITRKISSAIANAL